MTIKADREIALRSYHQFVVMAWPHANEKSPLVDNWHIRQMANDAQALVEFRLSEVVYNVPPGSGKTSVFGNFLAPWVWATKSTAMHFMYASFDLSLLNNSSEKMITLIRSDWYRARWPHVELASDAHRETKTTGGGARYNTTFKGGGTGRHAHYQIIDDPIKPKDLAGGALVTQTELESTWRTIHDTLATRKKDPVYFGRLMVMQRLHEDDPAGRAIKEGWTPRVFPLVFDKAKADPLDPRTVDGAEALAAKRYEDIPPESLLTPRWSVDLIEPEVKRVGGTRDFYTQYQQEPAEPGGSIIKEIWIEPFRFAPGPFLQALISDKSYRQGFWAQSWDLAFKKTETSDHVSGGYWFARYERNPRTQKLEPHFYLMPKPFFARASFRDCKAVLRDWKTTRPCSAVYIEDKANGPAIEDDLTEEFQGLLHMVEPRGSKVVRLTARTGLFEGGQVHLPEGPDYERLKNTLTRFPNVKFDDEVDMTSQALGEMGQSAQFINAMDRAKPLFDGSKTNARLSFRARFGR